MKAHSQNHVQRNSTGWRAVTEMHVMGTVKETARDSEVIHFELDMGPLMKLLFICNIPDEGQDQAPVYVKVLVP